MAERDNRELRLASVENVAAFLDLVKNISVTVTPAHQCFSASAANAFPGRVELRTDIFNPSRNFRCPCSSFCAP